MSARLNPFDWKTSYCDCGSKLRKVDYKLNNTWVVTCGKCFKQIGWLPETMPADVAGDFRCNYGNKHKGKKLKHIPKDYLEWLDLHAVKISPILRMAVTAILEEERNACSSSGGGKGVVE